MIVGVPTEIKADARRVSLTPAGVAAFRSHGHRVVVQRGAGVGSGFTDKEYREAGAKIADGAAPVWKRAEMILKVKEPQPVEYRVRIRRATWLARSKARFRAEPARPDSAARSAALRSCPEISY